MGAMAWEVEVEPEVSEWYLALSADERDIAGTHIELLANAGHTLRMPHSRQLGAGLCELRFDMSARSQRVTYWFRPDGVIVLLSVFHKSRNNEAAQIARARKALQACRDHHSP